jgi:hypothetical protein
MHCRLHRLKPVPLGASTHRLKLRYFEQARRSAAVALATRAASASRIARTLAAPPRRRLATGAWPGSQPRSRERER